MITNWRKSTYSEPTQSCVEFGEAGELHGVRDSKNPLGEPLVFTPRARAAFVGLVRRQAGASAQ